MSQMPNKIWLHKDTKYSTGDIVCGYQYDFVQGIEDEGGIENFVKYVPADAFIEKACEGIEHLLSGYIIRNFHFGDSYKMDKLIEDFKNYMKG